MNRKYYMVLHDIYIVKATLEFNALLKKFQFAR